LLTTGLYAYLYAASRVTSPAAEPGYGTSWSFQLTMFSIFRLPLLLVALAAVLLLERRLTRSQ
jgi:hypothetical protein